MSQNRLINNLSFKGKPADLDPTAFQASNSWQIASVSKADFTSLDSSLALQPRNAEDYTLQSNAFLHLAEKSDLIDCGTPVDLPFHGEAPDLGAFESEFSSAVGQDRSERLERLERTLD